MNIVLSGPSPSPSPSADKTDALLAAVMETVEKEDTPQSYAYAFLAAAVIPNVDLSPVFETIEDIVAQADETPSTLYVREGRGTHLCWEDNECCIVLYFSVV